ncbi:GCG_CRPN prefix-to-repeats domain-containing protein [Methylobacterium amylolyticum]|uniref:GCG_CRPN prefix-to-repeats domain-containing protein n=1 Tax=Methylobacterium sp. NEAU 140 TaxID=3064945 RepID=UPI0035212849
MKFLAAGALGAIVFVATLTSVSTPASALGGCGRNGHRNAYGVCVFGGQNESWCLRNRGRRAVRMPNGTMRCF